MRGALPGSCVALPACGLLGVGAGAAKSTSSVMEPPALCSQLQVIEGTGVFIDTKGASKHIEAGAKKVRIFFFRDPLPTPHSPGSKRTLDQLPMPVHAMGHELSRRTRRVQD